MQALTTTCALIASAALTFAVLAAPNASNIPTQAASYAALDQAIGDYRLDASLDTENLAAGAIVTLMRTTSGYALALPGDPFASTPVKLAVEADATGAPVLVLTHNDRSVRAHRAEALS
jgi:hypothetical protein